MGTELCYDIRQQNVSFNDENDMVLHQSESWFWHCVLLLQPCWLLLHVVINPVNDIIISSCTHSSTWNSGMYMFVREMLGIWPWYLPGMGSCCWSGQLPQPGRELIHQSMRCCQHGSHHQVLQKWRTLQGNLQLPIISLNTSDTHKSSKMNKVCCWHVCVTGD